MWQRVAGYHDDSTGGEQREKQEEARGVCHYVNPTDYVAMSLVW